jgi:hypothetical protein
MESLLSIPAQANFVITEDLTGQRAEEIFAGTENISQQGQP